METVLLTNGFLSKTLAVVRSLGSKGIRTLVAEKSRYHTSGFSKYCSKTLLSPDVKTEPERYLTWLIDTVNREQVDTFIPMDDDTMQFAIKYRHQLEPICKVPLPPTESYHIAADKGKTLRRAAELGVPAPRTVFMEGNEAITAEWLRKLTGSMQYPLVIKPTHSSGSRGIRFVESPEALFATYNTVHEQYPYPLIQELIPQGKKYDVCVCYDAGHELKATFVQQEIRNYPIERGPSTVHESAYVPGLIEHTQKLMDGMEWIGVADVEYMIDPRNGEPKLMEINPRFWSSTHLSIRSGVDFPWILYQLAGGQEVQPVNEYIVGKRGRSLLPGDILHFLSNPKRMAMDPPFWTTTLPDDILSKDDPWPTFGFFLSALRYGWQPQTWRFVLRR